VNTIQFNFERMQRDAFSQGLTATALAKRARVSVMTVSRFLRGQSKSPSTAKKLAKALGHGVDRYLADEHSGKAVVA